MTGSGGARLSLYRARLSLAEAEESLAGWYDRDGNPVGYAGDGHRAVRLVDELLWELVRMRAALLVELRADAEERVARVDQLLAAWRSRW